MTFFTGDHVADLLARADAAGCSWATAEEALAHPYVVDDRARLVWVDGRLELRSYFEAISAGLDELIEPRRGGMGTVTPIRRSRRPRPAQRITG